LSPPPSAEAPPRRLTRKEKQAQTREQLLSAAERVFIREGFAGASAERISAEAGFTRGAFYSNFESKERLFVELLHDRIFSVYSEMLEKQPELTGPPRERLRKGVEGVRGVQEHERGRWLFQLWLELMALAARDEEFRSLAATFWSGNRAMATQQIADSFRELGREPPIEPKHIATAMTALDIGLAVQHLVDPDEVPLDLYVPLYDLLFGRLVAEDSAE
jgi:AcrR family transcriptional regulator